MIRTITPQFRRASTEASASLLLGSRVESRPVSSRELELKDRIEIARNRRNSAAGGKIL